MVGWSEDTGGYRRDEGGLGWLGAITASAAVPVAATSGHQLPLTVSDALLLWLYKLYKHNYEDRGEHRYK